MKKSIKYLNVTLIAIISIGLLFILLRLVSIITTQNQSAAEAQASGFGENATKDLFAPAADLFANTQCEDIFNKDMLTSDALPELKAANLTVESITNLPIENYKPLTCEFKFTNGKSFTFSIHSYDANSPIDDSQEALFGRVNEVTLGDSTIDSDTMGIMTYFFGKDVVNTNVCRTNLYHPINDFEYADILYTGFDCSTMYNLNREISGVFNKYMFEAMEFVYVNFDNTTTADLLDTWGFSSLKSNLNFYE
ncbi:MAG: hypothetical protein ACMG57_04620 [Candidatus Dojkabacteria bacterium]